MSKDEKVEKGKSQDRRGGGRGTHGSITKAGKVRDQTPKIPKSSPRRKHGPLKQNRIEYSIRLKRIKSLKETSESKPRRRSYGKK